VEKTDRQDEQFEPLLKSIAAAEAGLRSSFENTPLPRPDTVARIKNRLKAEIRPRRRVWTFRAGAMAAAVLLAAGTGLYFHSGPDLRMAGNGNGNLQASADSSDANLESFTASLPAVQDAEDPAMQQLTNDVKELEVQTSMAWSNG
jgi:hypothetical protein